MPTVPSLDHVSFLGMGASGGLSTGPALLTSKSATSSPGKRTGGGEIYSSSSSSPSSSAAAVSIHDRLHWDYFTSTARRNRVIKRENDLITIQMEREQYKVSDSSKKMIRLKKSSVYSKDIGSRMFEEAKLENERKEKVLLLNKAVMDNLDSWSCMKCISYFSVSKAEIANNILANNISKLAIKSGAEGNNISIDTRELSAYYSKVCRVCGFDNSVTDTKIFQPATKKSLITKAIKVTSSKNSYQYIAETRRRSQTSSLSAIVAVDNYDDKSNNDNKKSNNNGDNRGKDELWHDRLTGKHQANKLAVSSKLWFNNHIQSNFCPQINDHSKILVKQRLSKEGYYLNPDSHNHSIGNDALNDFDGDNDMGTNDGDALKAQVADMEKALSINTSNDAGISSAIKYTGIMPVPKRSPSSRSRRKAAVIGGTNSESGNGGSCSLSLLDGKQLDELRSGNNAGEGGEEDGSYNDDFDDISVDLEEEAREAATAALVHQIVNEAYLVAEVEKKEKEEEKAKVEVDPKLLLEVSCSKLNHIASGGFEVKNWSGENNNTSGIGSSSYKSTRRTITKPQSAPSSATNSNNTNSKTDVRKPRISTHERLFKQSLQFHLFVKDGKSPPAKGQSPDKGPILNAPLTAGSFLTNLSLSSSSSSSSSPSSLSTDLVKSRPWDVQDLKNHKLINRLFYDLKGGLDEDKKVAGVDVVSCKPLYMPTNSPLPHFYCAHEDSHSSNRSIFEFLYETKLKESRDLSTAQSNINLEVYGSQGPDREVCALPKSSLIIERGLHKSIVELFTLLLAISIYESTEADPSTQTDGVFQISTIASTITDWKTRKIDISLVNVYWIIDDLREMIVDIKKHCVKAASQKQIILAAAGIVEDLSGSDIKSNDIIDLGGGSDGGEGEGDLTGEVNPFSFSASTSYYIFEKEFSVVDRDESENVDNDNREEGDGDGSSTSYLLDFFEFKSLVMRWSRGKHIIRKLLLAKPVGTEAVPTTPTTHTIPMRSKSKIKGFNGGIMMNPLSYSSSAVNLQAQIPRTSCNAEVRIRTNGIVQQLLQQESKVFTFQPQLVAKQKQMDNSTSMRYETGGRRSIASVTDKLYEQAHVIDKHKQALKDNIEKQQKETLSFQPHLHKPPKSVQPRYRVKGVKEEIAHSVSCRTRKSEIIHNSKSINNRSPKLSDIEKSVSSAVAGNGVVIVSNYDNKYDNNDDDNNSNNNSNDNNKNGNKDNDNDDNNDDKNICESNINDAADGYDYDGVSTSSYAMKMPEDDRTLVSAMTENSTSASTSRSSSRRRSSRQEIIPKATLASMLRRVNTQQRDVNSGGGARSESVKSANAINPKKSGGGMGSAMIFAPTSISPSSASLAPGTPPVAVIQGHRGNGSSSSSSSSGGKNISCDVVPSVSSSSSSKSCSPLTGTVAAAVYSVYGKLLPPPLPCEVHQQQQKKKRVHYKT